jgi:parvulin-like peptidyl-prolyl isomerase
MNTPNAFKIGNISIPLNQLPELIERYHLAPQLVREIVIDRAIIDYQVTADEKMKAVQNFYQQNKINNDQDLEKFLQHQRLDKDRWLSLIERKLQLQKFKDAEWGSQIEAYFSQRKSKIDQVIYSMIRLKDIDVAEELYFRLLSREVTFAELAAQYSIGSEAKTRGINGPIELGQIDATLVVALLSAKLEEVLAPINLNGWWIILQLEAVIPAELNESTQQRLKDELFSFWIIEQIEKVIKAEITLTESFFDISIKKLALIAQDATIDSVKSLHEKGIPTYGVEDGILHKTKPDGEVVIITNQMRVR